MALPAVCGELSDSDESLESRTPGGVIEEVSARSRGQDEQEELGLAYESEDSEAEDNASIVALEDVALRGSINRAIDEGSLSQSQASALIEDSQVLPGGRGRVMSDASRLSGRSIVSGSANRSLDLPLAQLEEIELKSFLKNFGKHTRQLHVPASARNPRARMPQWSDFRVPPDEAARAAAEGRRVTVLSHVDQGLRAMRREVGEGAPMPRPLQPTVSKPASKKEKRALSSEKVPLPLVNGGDPIDKSEREAKEEAKRDAKQEEGPSKARINVHDDDVEFRPSEDSNDWTLLDPAEADVEVRVDSYKDEEVDGIVSRAGFRLQSLARLTHSFAGLHHRIHFGPRGAIRT